MSEPTIRERVRKIAAEMLSLQPVPERLSAFEVSLAGLLGPILEEVCAAEVAFRCAVMDADAKTAAARRQIAEAGPAFRRLAEAKATYESCDQMLKTCRSALRLKTEEMRLAR